jgi:hypothetical protein
MGFADVATHTLGLVELLGAVWALVAIYLYKFSTDFLAFRCFTDFNTLQFFADFERSLGFDGGSLANHGDAAL